MVYGLADDGTMKISISNVRCFPVLGFGHSSPMELLVSEEKNPDELGYLYDEDRGIQTRSE